MCLNLLHQLLYRVNNTMTSIVRLKQFFYLMKFSFSTSGMFGPSNRNSLNKKKIYENIEKS